MKKVVLIVIAMTCIGLTGCGKSYTLTEEQNDMVAEYMAGQLLKYDKDYKEELIEITPTPIPSATPTPTPSPSASSAPSKEPSDSGDSEAGSKEVGISKILEKNGFTVAFDKYGLYDSYPEGQKGYGVSAGENQKILVVKWKVKNTNKEAKTFDLSKDNVVYQFLDEKGKAYIGNLSILPDDIHYAVQINGGESKQLLTIFKIPKSISVTDKCFVVCSKGSMQAKIAMK